MGFIFGGDDNLTTAPWRSALLEEGGRGLTFDEPQFLYDTGRKGGDLMFAAARRGADFTVYENNCRVAGRESNTIRCLSNGHARPPLVRGCD